VEKREEILILSSIDRLNDTVGKMVSFLVWIGAAILVWEVVSRYAFGAPTIWAHGYTQRVFGSYFIMLGAFTLVRGGHVRIDIFLANRGTRRRAVLDVLNYSMLLIWGAALTYEAWYFLQESLLWGEVDDSALGHPLWPIKLCLLLGSGLITLQAIAEIIRAAIGVVSPNLHHAGYH